MASGSDWLAIRCPVIQGESERGAYETLFITGVNMALCQQSQIDLLRDFLFEKIKAFSEEVVPKQLWIVNKKSLVLASGELSTWEKDNRLQRLPQIDSLQGEESSPLPGVLFNTALILVLFLILAGFFFYAFSESFPSWNRHQQPKNEKLFAALASISASIGISKEELATNILVEDGLLASMTAEKRVFSIHGLFMQISTLSTPITNDGSAFLFVSSSSSPVENALLIEVFGKDAGDPVQAMKARKFLYEYGMAWARVEKIHENISDLSKEFVDYQPQIFRSILRNQSLFADPIGHLGNPPLTPFFRKQDAFLARLFKQHFLGQDASFQGILDPKDKGHREWRSRWQAVLTMPQLAELLQEGLSEAIKKTLLEDPQGRSVIEHIGANYGSDEAELKKWVAYRDQVNEGNKAITSLIETIMNNKTR